MQKLSSNPFFSLFRSSQVLDFPQNGPKGGKGCIMSGDKREKGEEETKTNQLQPPNTCMSGEKMAQKREKRIPGVASKHFPSALKRVLFEKISWPTCSGVAICCLPAHYHQAGIFVQCFLTCCDDEAGDKKRLNEWTERDLHVPRLQISQIFFKQNYSVNVHLKATANPSSAPAFPPSKWV